MVAKQPQFSPKQIADALQASESSVKRWCDRGAIPTIRTVGGHRRITLQALQQFLQESDRSLADPDALGASGLALRATDAALEGGHDPEQLAFRLALARGEEARCRQILRRRLEQGATRTAAMEFLITDAMHAMGAAWERSDVDPYQERRGCEICLRLIHYLRSELSVLPAGAPSAIGGTLSGDPYQLPTAMAELSLREIGYDAVNLGNDLPVESFTRAVLDYQPKVVWLSISSITNPMLIVEQANYLSSQLDETVSFLVGGRALTEPIRRQMQYTAYCRSLRELVEVAAMIRAQPSL